MAIEGQQVPKCERVGLIMYDTTGHMAVEIMPLDRPKFASGNILQATQEEIKAAFDGYAAYFGPYEVNRLTLIPTNMVDGKLTPKSSATVRLIWERVK